MVEELIYYAAAVVIRIVVISAKYATILPWRFSEYRNSRLKPDEFEKDLGITWVKQHDEILVRELLLSMNRSNSDKALF